MSCEDIPSLLDLQNAKKNVDDLGRLMGTGEGDSTNEVTGQVRPTYNKVMKNIGFKPGSGDFTTGFTVMPGERDIAWYDPVSKNWYSYLGVIPIEGYFVPRTTNPVSSSLWKPVTDQTLRHELASTLGASLSGTTSGGTVQESIDGILSLIPSSVSAHNQDAAAHPQLRAFITSEANRAETAANAAAVTANVFESTAAGIAGTTAGKYFSVVSSTDVNYLDLYRNVSGVATYQKSYPSTKLVSELDAAKNKITGDNGFAMDGSDGMDTIELKKGEAKALVIGDYSNELMTFDTEKETVVVPSSELSDTKITNVLHTSDSLEEESENTVDLITSTRAKVIGNARASLVFDTVNNELVTTFKLVDKSQNRGVSFDNDIPDIITGIPADHLPVNRKFQGVPSIARTGDRFWAVWWADKNVAAEAADNFFVIAYSDDNCVTFTESHILKFSNDQHKVVDSNLWLNPETGELWLFWGSFGKAQAQDGIGGCWCSVLENPNATMGFSWSRPHKYRNIGDPRRIIRVAGKWMQGIDMWKSDAAFPPIYPDTAGCEFVEFDPRTKTTTDIGHNSPNATGGTAYAGFFETEFVQLTDGRLMSVTRGFGSTGFTRSFSNDGGKTWSPQVDYSVLGPISASRLWLGRTPSGRLLIVYNNDTVRRTLTVKISEDEGETFPYAVVLEGAATPETVSYPVVAFDGDIIYTIYDYGRTTAKEIRVTVVKESEILSGVATPDINIISGPIA